MTENIEVTHEKNPGDSFRKSNFAMLFNKNTIIDSNLKILQEKHKTYTKIIKNSEMERAQSVKLLAKRIVDKRKIDNDMKHTRIIKKDNNIKASTLIQGYSLIFDVKPKITSITCHWSKFIIDGWIPEAREGSSLTGYNNKLFLVGGLSRNILNQVLQFSILEGK